MPDSPGAADAPATPRKVVVSGASGLILELLWTRMLTLVFGSTTLAVSTVLTAFMGGLGLGSYLAGRVADRLLRVLRERRPAVVVRVNPGGRRDREFDGQAGHLPRWDASTPGCGATRPDGR